MARYALNYDLRGGHDYDPLYVQLRGMNAAHVTESCWCFYHPNATTEGLFNLFRALVHQDDSLWVTRVVEYFGINPIETLPE